jgi:hypothetical protein
VRSRVCCAVLLLAALVGCSGDEEPSAEPTTTGSAESSTTGSPTSEPSPSITPAEGQRVDTEVVTFRLPEGGWRVDGSRASLLDDGGQYWDIAMIHAPAFGIGLDKAAADRLDSRREYDNLRLTRSPNRTVDGLDGFVLEGVNADDGKGMFYEFGVINGDNTVFLEFEFPKPTAKARAWVESVLATVKWK